MLYLKRGNKGPSVVTLQVILNRSSGAGLVVDGIFGRRTADAVRAFQGPHGLRRDGIVGRKTWPKLAASSRLSVADVVDVDDKDLMDTEVADIRRAGGNPIVLGGMCNGVGQAALEIRRHNPELGSIAIIRFYGHGGAGDMNVSAGFGGDSRADLSGISYDNLSLVAPALRSVTPHLADFGCVEFHGCNVGRGSRGRQLVRGVSAIIDRPVSAGRRSQYAGGYETFRFEGPVTHGYPGNVDLRAWGARHSSS